MTPGATMQKQAERQAETAKKAREFAVAFVRDMPPGTKAGQIRLDLASRADEVGVDRTVLWIAVRDELRKSR